MVGDIKVITTKYPTYLQTLSRKNDNIKLVYRQNNVLYTIVNGHSVDDTEVSKIDLTGNPLEVDLGQEDTLCSNPELDVESTRHWTQEEESYGSIPLSQARRRINNELGSKSLALIPTFCLCDGIDEQKTVILGATRINNSFINTVVNILPSCNENDEEKILDYVVKQHLKSGSVDSKGPVEITKCFNLLGFNLRNSSLLNVEQNGHIAVEISKTDKSGQVFSNNDISKTLFQVVLGHPGSLLHSLWNDIATLYFFVDILKKGVHVTESHPLATKNILEYTEIEFIIKNYFRNISSIREVKCKGLDLQNLRSETIFDMLWKTLKWSKSVFDLRNSFQCFFEEVLENQTGITTANNGQSLLAQIVNGLINGQLGVPVISLIQSIELLIDLGLEKLKNDYLVIISNYYTSGRKLILQKWKNLTQNISQLKPSKSTTRFSITPKMALTDLTKFTSKLSLIHSLHIVVEFMLLFKNNLDLEDHFEYFSEAVCSKVLDAAVPVFQQLHLCEFEFCSFAGSIKDSLKSKVPSSWSIKFISKTRHSDVTTIYHLSEHPLFPECVYNGYENIEEDANAKTFFVTKYTELTC